MFDKEIKNIETASNLDSCLQAICKWESFAIEDNKSLIESFFTNSLVRNAAYNSEKNRVINDSNDRVADLKGQIV